MKIEAEGLLDWAAEAHEETGGVASLGSVSRHLDLSRNELRHHSATALVREALTTIVPDRIRDYVDYGPAMARVSRFLGVSENRLTFAPGSDAAIQCICQSLGHRARGLTSLAPSYEAWTIYAALRPLPHRIVVDPRAYGRRIDEGQPWELLDIVSRRHGEIISVTTPDGALGNTLTTEFLSQLSDVCLNNDNVLVIDHCYSFFHNGPPVSLLDLPAIHLVSFSKGLGMAGARLAAVVGPEHQLAHLRANRIEGGVNGAAMSLVEYATASNVLPRWEAVWSDVRFQRQQLTAALTKILPAWKVRQGFGNFVTLSSEDRDSEIRLITQAAVRGVKVRALSALVHGVDGGIRITVGDAHVTSAVVEIADALAGASEGEETFSP